jgi:hypothetical protein
MRPTRPLSILLALVLAAVLSGCCSDCIKDPPCCKQPAAAPAPAK